MYSFFYLCVILTLSVKPIDAASSYVWDDAHCAYQANFYDITPDIVSNIPHAIFNDPRYYHFVFDSGNCKEIFDLNDAYILQFCIYELSVGEPLFDDRNCSKSFQNGAIDYFLKVNRDMTSKGEKSLIIILSVFGGIIFMILGITCFFYWTRKRNYTETERLLH